MVGVAIDWLPLFLPALLLFAIAYDMSSEFIVTFDWDMGTAP